MDTLCKGVHAFHCVGLCVWGVLVSLCVGVWVFVCMCVCLRVCNCAEMFLLHVCRHVDFCLYMYLSMYICMYVYL